MAPILTRLGQSFGFGASAGVAEGPVASASDTPTGHTATGGIIADYADPGPGKVYRSHTFMAPGEFNISALSPAYAATVDWVAIGGGGGGGKQHGGGGGAGGFTATPGQPVGANPYPVTIGVGGRGSFNGGPGAPKGDFGGETSSPLIPMTLYGGGGGGSYNPSGGSYSPGMSGASGGGGGSVTSGGAPAGGDNNKTPTGGNTPAQGASGGAGGVGDSPNRGGGGGGAAPPPSGDGSAAPPTAGGDGGTGSPDLGYSLGTANTLIFGGGGAGGGASGPGGNGGSDIGGDGGKNTYPTPAGASAGYGWNGVASGGGGGGGGPAAFPGGRGGIGKMVVRYQIGTVAADGAPTNSQKATGGHCALYNNKWIHTFTRQTNSGPGVMGVDVQAFTNTTGAPIEVEYVVIGGGGAGANPNGYCGGGGAGGYRTGTLTVPPGSNPVSVGQGGLADYSYNHQDANQGQQTTFATIIVKGGGAGGGKGSGPGGNADNRAGNNSTDTPTAGGGSGGGGGSYGPNTSPGGTSGTYGNDGAAGGYAKGGGGGGGAGGAGSSGGGPNPNPSGGGGGAGVQLPATFRDPRMQGSLGWTGPSDGTPGYFWVAGGGGGGANTHDEGNPTSGRGGGPGSQYTYVWGPRDTGAAWCGAGDGGININPYKPTGVAAGSAIPGTGSGGGGSGFAQYGGNGGDGLVLVAYPKKT